MKNMLATLSIIAILLTAGCRAAGPVVTAGDQPTSSDPGSSPVASPVATTIATPAPSRTAPLPPVEYAAITALTADSVSWIDAKQVPAQANNVKIETLEGAAHKHSAPLSPDATFFLPQDNNGEFHVDQTSGVGTSPCDRAAMADFVVGAFNSAPRLTFDAQGRVATMAARYHP